MDNTTTPEKEKSTKEIKAFIHDLGIDLVGIADLSKLDEMQAGLDINLADLFQKYSSAIVIGAQYGKAAPKSSGKENVLYLEKIVYDVMEYLEEKEHQYLVIHPEDEYDPDKRMGLLSLKVLAKHAGLGWQGRSLLIVSPLYGPIHRLIAVLTNMPLTHDMPLQNRCNDCMICVEKCPKNSLTLCRFDDHPDSREDVLDIQTCIGDFGCLVCIKNCPYFKN